jgi:hypothetical protein
VIPVITLGAAVLPKPAALGSSLEVSIVPVASGSSQSIVPGSSVAGSSVVFSDLHGLAAYKASVGLVTANRGRKGLRRTARGGEDGNSRQA